MSLGQEEANIVGGWGVEPADRGAHDSFHPSLLDSSFLVRAEVRFPDYRKSIADGPLRTPILGSRRDSRRADCSHLNIIASRLPRELSKFTGNRRRRKKGRKWVRSDIWHDERMN